MQPQELLAGSPNLPGLPMGRAAALPGSGETLHGQLGPWAAPAGRLGRATSPRSPSHVTVKGWWERAQGLLYPIPPAWPWENPLGWWLRHLGAASLPLHWSQGCKGCSWPWAPWCFVPSKDLPISISFFSGLEAVSEPPTEEHPLKMSWPTCSPWVWYQHAPSASNSSSLPSVLTWVLKGERRPAHPCTMGACT